MSHPSEHSPPGQITVRVTGADLACGQRPAYDILDSQGKALLMRGALIATEAQATLLRNTGFRTPAPARGSSGFVAMGPVADRLAAVEQDIMSGQSSGVWPRRLSFLAKDFIDIADADPDGAFASIHLDLRNNYMVVHHLMAAMVCARLGLATGMNRPARQSLVAAALTHDIGLMAMKPLIDASADLSPEIRERVRQHVDESVSMLQRLGIDDPLWLNAVNDHHECLNGSGYHGKVASELSTAARIIGIADIYSALLRPRPYRERVIAHAALESLYASESDRYDGQLIELLIWDLGFYPPGSLLRLANRELAVAIRNTPGILDQPIVAALTDGPGRPYLKPVIRDTNQPEFAIMGTLDPAMAARAGRMIEQCWAATPTP